MLVAVSSLVFRVREQDIDDEAEGWRTKGTDIPAFVRTLIMLSEEGTGCLEYVTRQGT